MKKLLFIAAAISLAEAAMFPFAFSLPKNQYSVCNDFQYGPSSQNIKNHSDSGNKNLDYFFGDSDYNYTSFYENKYGLQFNGNLKNIKKTKAINKPINMWRNEYESKQLILVPNGKLNNVKISIKPKFKNDNVILTANFLNYIKSNNKIESSSIRSGISFTPDEIGQDYLEETKFDLHPVLLTAQTKDDENIYGEFLFDVIIEFDKNNIKESFKFEQVVNVKNKTLIKNNSNLDEKNKFTFNSMITPTNSFKYIFDKKNTKENKNTFKIPEIPEVIDDGTYFEWSSLPSNDYLTPFLRPQYRDKMVKNYKFSNDVDSQYAYMNPFGNSFIQTIVKNTRQNLTTDQYLSYLNNSAETLINDEKLEWSFNLSSMKEFVEFAVESGFESILIPVIPRNVHDVKFYYLFEEEKLKKDIPLSALNGSMLEKYGQINEYFKLYMTNILPKLFREIIDLIDKNASNPNWITKNGKPIQFLYSFDETSFEANKFASEQIKAVDKNNIFKSHAFIGWQFKVDKNNWNDIEEKVVNYFDWVTLQQREYLFDITPDILMKIANKRYEQGKVTWIYSSWNNYPAAFIGSAVNESIFVELYSKKMKLNGFTRFSLEGYKNDISIAGEDNSASYEPGDSYILYPGYGEGSLLSHRALTIRDGYEMVLKLEQSDNLHFLDKLKLNDNLKNRDTDYKWNLNFFEDNDLGLIKATSLSEQVELIKELIKRI